MTMTATEIRWTADDQASHIASVKKELARLLENDYTFETLDAVSHGNKAARDCMSVTLLCISVTSLRSELLEWCKT
jgi:hypothetical protein